MSTLLGIRDTEIDHKRQDLCPDGAYLWPSVGRTQLRILETDPRVSLLFLLLLQSLFPLSPSMD